MPHHEYLDCLDMQETSVAELRKALFEQGKRLAAAEAGASAVLARIAWTLQENQQSVDVLTQKLISAEQRAERLAGACQGLLEQVRHDNESEATHHAVADGFDASEFGAYMPSAWHKGHAALDDAESCASAQGNEGERLDCNCHT